MAEYKRVCNFCHKDFTAQKYTTRYCSTRCASRANKMQTRLHQQNMFNDNETYKRLLNRILASLESIELALNLQSTKEQAAQDNLLTPEQYCKMKQIHQRTLRRMIQRREIATVKLHNKIFIPKDQLFINH